MNKATEIIRQVMERCRVPLQVPIPVPVRRPQPRVIGTMAAIVAALSVAAASQAAPIRSQQVDGQLVDVQVLVDGWATPIYARPGAWDKSYFQAFKGKNYSLVLKNQTNERVGVLIAVDGLNVVNGERSNLSNREAMYVLDPYESATIQGWRTSLRDVRRFVFVDEERSYASRTDQANGDMGWIRVLSFREKTQRVAWKVRPNSNYRDDAREESRGESMPAPSLGGDLRAQKSGERLNQAPQSDDVPGTGWGDQRWDPVQQTRFVAMANATDHLVLRYEYESGLRALGIFPQRQRRVFQRERGELGFAQPPTRW